MNSLQSLSKIGMKILTVGISGVTCGGKSSLTHLLKSAFPKAKLIHQDDFYFTNVDALPKAPDGTNRANWDSLESLDMVSMTLRVQEIYKTLSEETQPTTSLIIIDGFLIFNYPPLAELCNLKYFVTLPFEECLARRKKRDYNPPDPPGYFEEIAWPMFLKNMKDMRQSSFANKIQYLDGTANLQENFQRIINDVEAYYDAI